MRVAVCKKANQIELEERTVPELKPDQVLVKVAICGICSSDLAAWRGSGHKKYPYSPGHEFGGIIEKAGNEVNNFRVGDRVVINPNLGCGECEYCLEGKPNLCDNLKSRNLKSNGGFSDYVAIDYRMVYHLPNNVPNQLIPFIEPCSCALHIINTANIKKDDQIIIYGAGIMGILVCLLLKSTGKNAVIIEKAPKRIRQFSEILNDKILTPENFDKAKKYNRIDIAIECSGSAHALNHGIKILRKGGCLIMAGIIMDDKALFPFIDITTKEITIKGAWLNPVKYEQAIQIISENNNTIEQLKIGIFTLSNIEDAFLEAANNNYNKIIVKP